MRNRTIVVGTDGTDCGMRAVEWAAGEAQRRRMPLRIVHAYDWDWDDSRFQIDNEYIYMAQSFAETITTEAVDRARHVAADIEIHADAIIGHASPRLLDESREAELLVVGNRGRGGFAGLMLGSVSQRLAMHAACPVVVVRGREVTDGPVAAGVDDSPAADHVLETAFDAAAQRGCAVVVVRSFLPVIPLWLADVRPVDVPTPAEDAAERVRLEEQLAPWRAKYPDVPVEVVLTHDSAGAALVNASARAQLVVVGSRGRGVVSGALLGSAGLQLLHHANCPVLVAREPVSGKA